MVEPAITDAIRRYIESLRSRGIHPRQAVLFGSHSQGRADEWSDIDLIVVAPEFDADRSLHLQDEMWRAVKGTDDRIEPIACGVIEWEQGDTGRTIVEIARRDGVIITA